jgi:hypothetical protein
MVHAILGARGPMGKDLHRNWQPAASFAEWWIARTFLCV